MKQNSTRLKLKKIGIIVGAILLIQMLIPILTNVELTGKVDAETQAGGDEYYDYNVLDDETIEITEYKGSEEQPDIPSVIDGKSVTSIGDGAFSYCESLSSITIPNSVTSIGDSAFSYCERLEVVIIPDTVTSMGNWLFEECTSLEQINIPNNVTIIETGIFYNCSSLKDIIIPESVTSIYSYAFEGCSSLTNIEIPENVTDIESNPFAMCSNLNSITVNENNESYMSEDGLLYTKYGKELIACPGKKENITIPDNVESIVAHAFEGCSSLKSITIPSGVTSIKMYTFSECSSLTNITIPDSVESIGKSAFWGCDSLTNIEIPNSVASIGDSAFARCSSLTNITIPSDITTIESGVFRECESLTNITIPDSVTSIGDWAFYKCESLTSIEIPSSVKQIGKDAFKWCSSLTNIEIPENVIDIESNPFAMCSNLNSITVNENNELYKSIDGVLYEADKSIDGVLYEADKKKLVSCPGNKKSIEILNSVDTIGRDAFCGCRSLEEITIPNSVKDIANENPFKFCDNLKEILVDENNESYMSEDGLLYTKDRKELIACPGNKEDIKISKYVETICYNAFMGCHSIKDIIIPESVTRIYSYAFEDAHIKIYYNDKTKEIKLPDIIKKAKTKDDVLYSPDQKFEKIEGGDSFEITEDDKVKIKSSANERSFIVVDGILNGLYVDIIEDNEEPTVGIIENPTTWTNGTVEITVNATDEKSGLADKPYSFDGGKEWTNDNKKTIDKYLSNLTVKVRDRAGNIAEERTGEIKIYISGDLNRDKKISIEDLLLLKRCMLRIEQQDTNKDDIMFKSADVDGDGNVNITDLLLLKRKMLKVD